MPGRPPKLTGKRRFAIVASRYNAEFVGGMVEAAMAELRALSNKPVIDEFEVPGSFEIPLAVKRALDCSSYDAVLAFGLIWEGETRHADLIATSVTNALMNICLLKNTPVLHEVLVVKTEEQARERCLGKKINRGIEAARAAALMCATMDELTPVQPEKLFDDMEDIPF